MKKKKEVECKGGCKHKYIEMVVLGCLDCIKHTAIQLTEKQINEIANIINPKKRE